MLSRKLEPFKDGLGVERYRLEAIYATKAEALAAMIALDNLPAASAYQPETPQEAALRELVAESQRLGLYDPPPNCGGMTPDPSPGQPVFPPTAPPIVLRDPERDDDEGESAPLPVPAYGGR